MEDVSTSVVLRGRGVTWALMDHSGRIAIQTQLHTPMLLPLGFTAVHVPIVHSDCCSHTVSSPAAHVAAHFVPENFERNAPQVSVLTVTGVPAALECAQHFCPAAQLAGSSHSHTVAPMTGHAVPLATQVETPAPLAFWQHCSVSRQEMFLPPIGALNGQKMPPSGCGGKSFAGVPHSAPASWGGRELSPVVDVSATLVSLVPASGVVTTVPLLLLEVLLSELQAPRPASAAQASEVDVARANAIRLFFIKSGNVRHAPERSHFRHAPRAITRTRVNV
jgi:hypothetical protein